VKADSFFNFFDPPQVPDDPTAEVDEDTQVQIKRWLHEFEIRIRGLPSYIPPRSKMLFKKFVL
jgi:hypothetical protein